jgi:hypothetical protein
MGSQGLQRKRGTQHGQSRVHIGSGIVAAVSITLSGDADVKWAGHDRALEIAPFRSDPEEMAGAVRG